MWHTGALAAATEIPATGGNDALLALIGGIIIAAIGAAATVIVAAINTRNNRTAPSPPAPDGTPDVPFRDFVVGELAVGRRRADDADERDEVQDRRLDQIERALDIDNTTWRHPSDDDWRRR